MLKGYGQNGRMRGWATVFLNFFWTSNPVSDFLASVKIYGFFASLSKSQIYECYSIENQCLYMQKHKFLVLLNNRWVRIQRRVLAVEKPWFTAAEHNKNHLMFLSSIFAVVSKERNWIAWRLFLLLESINSNQKLPNQVIFFENLWWNSADTITIWELLFSFLLFIYLDSNPFCYSEQK